MRDMPALARRAARTSATYSGFGLATIGEGDADGSVGFDIFVVVIVVLVVLTLFAGVKTVPQGYN